MPGDNDVGGEKAEPVDAVKVNWFGKSFGDLRTVTNVDKSGLNAQFIKVFFDYQFTEPNI